jgi:hypothetical protein
LLHGPIHNCSLFSIAYACVQLTRLGSRTTNVDAGTTASSMSGQTRESFKRFVRGVDGDARVAAASSYTTISEETAAAGRNDIGTFGGEVVFVGKWIVFKRPKTVGY